MKLQTGHQAGGSANLFLYVVLMFASTDAKSLFDYGLKALIGGVVWLAFKLAADYFSVRMNNKKQGRRKK